MFQGNDNVSNKNFTVLDVKFDNNPYAVESSISQGEEPNVLNRLVDWIRDNVLHIPTNGKQLDLAEIIRLKSLEENKPESEMKQQISEEFPSAIPQYYIHSNLSSFFNTATAGIIPEETKLTPETTTGKILQPLATGAMDLAGFIAFSLMTGGVGDIAKITKAGNYIERIGNLLQSVPIASKLADTYPFANAVKNALVQGLKFGGLTLADSLINMNEHTNNTWMAIKDLTPEALDNFIIGAGLPLAGKINSTFKRVLLALTLGNVASKITTGTTDISKLLDGIRMADPEAITNAVFNLGVQAFFGLASVEPRPEKEIKETQDFLNDLYDNVKLQTESQKIENFDLYTEPKNIDISFDKLLKQQQKANIETISQAEEIKLDEVEKVEEPEVYTDKETAKEINNAEDKINKNEVNKPFDKDIDYMFSVGLHPQMLKSAIEGTTELGRKAFKLIADDVEGYRATVFHMLLTPEFSQYSKNPIVRETFKDLQRNIFETQSYISNLTDDMKQKLENSALSLKSVDRSVAEKINEALVKGDAEKKNPLELIDNYDLSEKDRKVAKEVIKNIREFYDKAWNIKAKHYKQLIEKMQNSKIKSYANQVLESIYKVRKKYPYYIPRSRNVGNIKIDVYDTKTNKKVHSEIVLDYSPLFTGGKSIIAKIVADKLRKQYSDSKYDITISSVKNFNIKKDTDLYGILDYLGEVLDNVDLTDKQKEQIFGELVNYIKSTGFTAHLMRRAKNVIKGYNEDVLSVSHGYFNAFKASLLKSQLKEAFANALELAKQDNVVYKMVNSMFDEYMRNRDSLDKGIAMVKGFAFLKYLGFSMRQLVIQSTQTPIFTGMHLAVEEAKSKKATALDWVKAEANLIKSAKEYLTGEYKNDPVKTKFINDLEKTGVLNAQQTAFYTGKTSLLSNTWNKFTSAAGYIMAITERFNRYVSALSYINTHYDRLKSSLKENYADELYNVRSFVYLTNGKYGDTELPLFLQGADTVKRVARLGMIFQTFQIDMLQGMKKLMNEGQYTALLLGLGSMCFLGGLTALPFYNAIKSAYLNTTGRDMETDMVKFMGSNEFVDWLQSGLFGKAGIDISASLGLQTPLDMTPYMGDNIADQFATVVFGVSYASLKDTIKSIKYLGGGDLDKALYYGLPFRFLAYPIKAIDEYYRGITTNGDLLLVDPLTGKPLKLTLKEALLQAVGFTPQRVSEFLNIYYNYKTLSQYYQNKRKSLYMRYRNAIERGDWKLAREILMQGVKLNKRVSIINADYGISLPLFNVRSINTISKQVDLMRFMRYNYK